MGGASPLLPGVAGLSALERRLLNDFQRDFPLVSEPYAAIAERLGCSEAEVLAMLARLQERGVVSRVGVVFAPRQVGASTLAAMAVPGEALEAVAECVNRFPQVNHNYQRDGEYNLWFVVTAADPTDLAQTLSEIQEQCGHPLISLPLEEDYHIDLGFPLFAGE